MYCMHSGMAKGKSRAEATSNSEKLKPVALAIIELRELASQHGRKFYLITFKKNRG